MSKHYICTKCDYVGPRKKVKRGTLRTEIMLWVVLTPLGPFYSLWRMFSKINGCPACGEKVMVPQMDYKSEEELEKELSEENLAKIPDMWAKDREEYEKKQRQARQDKPQEQSKPTDKDDTTW